MYICINYKLISIYPQPVPVPVCIGTYPHRLEYRLAFGHPRVYPCCCLSMGMFLVFGGWRMEKGEECDQKSCSSCPNGRCGDRMGDDEYEKCDTSHVFYVHLVDIGEDRCRTWKPCPPGHGFHVWCIGIACRYNVRRNIEKTLLGWHTLALPVPPCLLCSVSITFALFRPTIVTSCHFCHVVDVLCHLVWGTCCENG